MDYFLQNQRPGKEKSCVNIFAKQNHVMAFMLHMVGIFAKCLENDTPTFLFQGRKQVFLSA